MSETLRGIITRKMTGHGFVRPDGCRGRDNDHLFLPSVVADTTFEELKEGQRVEFVGELGPRGYRATELRPAGPNGNVGSANGRSPSAGAQPFRRYRGRGVNSRST